MVEQYFVYDCLETQPVESRLGQTLIPLMSSENLSSSLGLAQDGIPSAGNHLPFSF
jgi:hypothetical protein